MSRDNNAGLPARRAAIAALDAVLTRKTPLDDSWGDALDGLASRDRGFARLLALTALRRLGRIDIVLDGFLSRRPTGKTRFALHALRIAAAEILFLDGAPHAATNSAVTLTKRDRGAERLSGLVNAVCRKIIQEGPEKLASLDPVLDAPKWLRDFLKQTWGAERMRASITAHAEGAPLDLTVKADAAGWAERLGGIVTPTGSVRLPGGIVEDLPGFETGDWWVQDAAAAVPARLLGDVKGLRVLDLCAAPGGKTLQLAAAGAVVTALDRSESRLARVRENLARTGLTAEIIAADALNWSPDAPFDAVLLDAPCSATGTIRRHPDLPHLRDMSGLAELTALQDALLDRAFDWLKPGGRLVYATCSVAPAEGEDRAAAFLSRTPQASRLSVVQEDLGTLETGESTAPLITPDGYFRSIPGQFAATGGIDGFFSARFEKL